ncbi:MAG: hypothetical protein FJY17_00305 [Bacteroidetes bacterium]|nr:hypothetical protein [Bacteroidota bacterium]
MDKKLQSSLYFAFPKIFVNKDNPDSCMKYGICCGSGWYKIIFNLCRDIQNFINTQDIDQITAEQIKEKLGTLSFDISHYPSAEKDRKMHIRSLIINAERKAAQTCGICGENGKLHQNKANLFKTLCKKDAKILNFSESKWLLH